MDIKLEGDQNPNTVVAVYYRPILIGVWDCFSIASGSPVSLRICVMIDLNGILKIARAQYRRSSECAERAKLRGMYCDRSLSVSVAVSDLNWLFLMPAFADRKC